MKKILYFIHDRTLAATNPCTENVRKISLKCDGSISLMDRINVFFHLKTCHCCNRYNKQIKQLHKLIENKSKQINSTAQYDMKLSPETTQRIKERLLQEM